MDYHNQGYHQQHRMQQKNYLTERNDRNKENIIPNNNQQNIMNNMKNVNINKMNNNNDNNNNNNIKMKEIPIEEYESLLCEVSKLRQDINLTNKVKSELLQVSKKETEEYANNVLDYSKQFESMHEQIQTLQQKLNEKEHHCQQQNEQLQTLAVGIEDKSTQNQRKDEQLQKLQQQNMSIQHGMIYIYIYYIYYLIPIGKNK